MLTSQGLPIGAGDPCRQQLVDAPHPQRLLLRRPIRVPALRGHGSPHASTSPAPPTDSSPSTSRSRKSACLPDASAPPHLPARCQGPEVTAPSSAQKLLDGSLTLVSFLHQACNFLFWG